jgi:hypothetical protein
MGSKSCVFCTNGEIFQQSLPSLRSGEGFEAWQQLLGYIALFTVSITSGGVA